MKLTTTLERYLFAAHMVRNHYEALKAAEPHIHESDGYKDFYRLHVRNYNFWQTAKAVFGVRLTHEGNDSIMLDCTVRTF